ncbi:hypothetical protein pEaSNUABM40_00088 [Erwinia phage pEa_SNUABM_40]|uniref:Uncharacterized protein n=1 Tax=Erwinia phage pEa_SNUABM_3 TaxID=2869552 RepID=A0AAE7XJ38_9CAUD|nr:hypothetical protein MPK68_gp088 [Erwinia phage pEa_SNUABM_3]QZE56624.1 hypothetical protein pEaSNUABM20_00088 [Erwinia phage pEa_SNUABM_20]QZE58304.1 hypothetical protein pEaSNUABM40_00088 [Erwinia phage pEa_SNUABM_40]UAW52869.1 hypothetical protein pEaSNUABM23_00087 [Erwinia phage pEa_SNUABM_23]UIW10765.1 hypothetical protein pEaSNUABM23_00087 [Erwinia phage pEa_SNUABM_31]QZE56285.1 hypothetical protein pEaSNUABM3_00088 [Erwinia phage pEa_SNUABM_3]
MNYKLFANSVVPQLTRLFAQATADDKSCYLVKLNAGFTEADINKCLNYQTQTGAGYVFDAALAASTGICTVLAKGTNCVRTIDRTKIAVSDCLLTATAEGVPTHLILGGILPVCLTVGTDVTLLYPDLNIKYDPNGYKTQITILAFNISLSSFWTETAGVTWLAGNETIAFDTGSFNTGAFTDYIGNAYTTSGALKVAADGSGIDLGTNGICTTSTPTAFDCSKSFTIECDYHQSGNSDYAEWCLLNIGGAASNRMVIAFDRSNERGLLIWNNVNGGTAPAKVTRSISPYSALWSGSVVHIKYVYDATTNTHTVFLNGTQVDQFTYALQKPVATNVMVQGGYGGGNAAFTPIINRYSVRQGA